MSKLNFIPSTRGGNLLVIDQYIYRINRKQKTGRTFWKCSVKKDCKARVVLNHNNDLEKETGSHNHEPSSLAIQKKLFRNKLKERSIKEVSTPVPRIYREELAATATSLEIASSLPRYETAQKTMYKARSSIKPVLPRTAEELVLILADPWTETKDEKDFLIDDGQANNRLLENQSMEDVTSVVSQNSDTNEEVQKVMTSDIGVCDNLETLKESRNQTNITIKTESSNQTEKLSKSVLTSRNKHPPLTKAPARPPPIYSKPQTRNFPRNTQPWRTLEDSYLALTSSNRELLIKLVNQALKKRNDFAAKLSKLRFQWTDFEIDGNQPSSVLAFGEKVVYHATMPQYPEYSLTLVIFIQQPTVLQENSDIKYPMFGKFSDDIPSEYLDTSGENEFHPNECLPATILVLDHSNILTIECFSEGLSAPLTEENEKEVCFITLQLIQSLKSLQVQGIESIDTSCQNLLLSKTKQDKYHNLIFLYDICYEENDYSSDSCKISLCQYTLMLLFQMLKIQAVDDPVLTSKFSSSMSRKIFETAFSLLSEEKAVSLSQTKTLFECYLWGVTKVLESLKDSDDYDDILHRWLDIERSNCIKCIVSEDSNDINTQNEFHSQFLIRTTVRNIREVTSYL